MSLRRAARWLRASSRCQRAPLRQPACTSRLFSTACARPDASAPRRRAPPAVRTGAAHSSSDEQDQALRLVFDSQAFWQQFCGGAASAVQPRRVGLLQNKYLTTPEGFRDFATASLRRCQALVEKVLAAASPAEYSSVVRDCDRLSDLLCRVMDIAEFIRMNHPDPRFQAAASDAHGLMFQYMNVLNTTPGLNAQLARAASDPEVSRHWTAEEKHTARILMADFAKSGIHLPPKQRQRFVELSSEINDLGVAFIQNPEPETRQLSLPLNRLQGMDPMLLRRIRSLTGTTAKLPIAEPYVYAALSTVADSAVRREVYRASRTASRRQIQRLERLLVKRAELAHLTGYASYGHMTLSDKMASTPDAVTEFLVTLNARNSTRVREDLGRLLRLKQAQQQQQTATLQPWDFSYYLNEYSLKHEVSRRSRSTGLLASYFSLGTVIQGISTLFERLYGVRFVPREAQPGETWDPEVRRLDVVDERDDQVAVLYCDLFSRSGKTTTPTHFTLRCSRAIPAAELAEDPTAHPNDGMATGRNERSEQLYQLPVIALVCDFLPPPADGQAGPPALLSQHEVSTLFHEMGHAVHSILGRTDFQTVSGTRCATDFAELPSVFNENFAFNPAVLSLYARHWQTGKPISDELKLALQRRASERKTLYGPVENENQILMALLDQAYHDRDASAAGPAIDSTQIYRRVYSAHSSLPDPEDLHTAWQGFFGHLFGYGATYYSYLLDRAIAGKIWAEVFRNGRGDAAIDREAGERMRSQVLKWGGARDGWECVAGVLGDVPGNEHGQLAVGGAAAMREVGSWGVDDPADG
ncbi:Mitochondrial intermediate peptidase [Ascosphaera acerosa]|nr:Mitochondrial intermediate peptidase [Ascosphaera acerosa]